MSDAEILSERRRADDAVAALVNSRIDTVEELAKSTNVLTVEHIRACAKLQKIQIGICSAILTSAAAHDLPAVGKFLSSVLQGLFP